MLLSAHLRSSLPVNWAVPCKRKRTSAGGIRVSVEVVGYTRQQNPCSHSNQQVTQNDTRRRHGSIDSCPVKTVHYHHHHHHHHHHHRHQHYYLHFNRDGLWGTTDDFATSFLHFPLFSTALWDLPNSRPVYFLMLSFRLFLCLPCLLPPFTVPREMIRTVIASNAFWFVDKSKRHLPEYPTTP